MGETTLEAPPLAHRPAVEPDVAAAEPWTLRRFARRHPWWTSAVAITIVSVAIVRSAGTRPSFDAYGWLVWGHQTLAGTLNTNAAPSWKPLPYVFTVPYALFGHYQIWLWMITVVAVSLAGQLAAGRIAFRLTMTGAPPTVSWGGRHRWAAWAASAFAAVTLLVIQDWWHYALSAQSDTMIVALCLGAIDCHLSRHPRWAFLLGVLACLGRPEAWPFLGLYSIWAWRAIPSMRPLVAGGVVAIVLLWFGIPALTSRSAFVAASNAFGSGRRLRSDQVLGTIRRFLDLDSAGLEAAAVLAVGWAVLRREWTVVALAAGVVLWVAIEIAFALHGWPGLGRYMFGAAGVTVVLAGLLVGRLLADAGPAAARHLRPPRLTTSAGWAGILLAGALVAILIPTAVSRARAERHDLRAQRRRTQEIQRLSSAVSALGGPKRLRACGEPLTRLEYQTVLAWTLQRNVAAVGFKYGEAIRHGDPIVLYTPIPSGGWIVSAVHQRAPGCDRLPRLAVR